MSLFFISLDILCIAINLYRVLVQELGGKISQLSLQMGIWWQVQQPSTFLVFLSLFVQNFSFSTEETFENILWKLLKKCLQILGTFF